MQYKIFDLKDTESKELSVVLKFDVATARHLNYQLLCLKLDENSEPKFIKNMTVCLKDMKKKGIIDLFVCSDDLYSGSTEAEYMLNKFPFLNNKDDLFIHPAVYVKL
jgi:hypothetical protein